MRAFVLVMVACGGGKPDEAPAPAPAPAHADAAVAPKADAAPPFVVPASCEAYTAAVARVRACAKLGPVRDELQRAYDATADAIAHPDALSPAARGAMAGACTRGTQAIDDALGAAACR